MSINKFKYTSVYQYTPYTSIGLCVFKSRCRSIHASLSPLLLMCVCVCVRARACCIVFECVGDLCARACVFYLPKILLRLKYKAGSLCCRWPHTTMFKI